jgi:hypothetical protein
MLPSGPKVLNPPEGRRAGGEEQETIEPMPRRFLCLLKTAVAITVLAVWALAVLSIDNGHVGVFHDDGIYLSSARSIREGKGYQLPGRPGNPPPKYPIGFPLLVAAMMQTMGEPHSIARDLLAARFVVVISGIVFFLACYWWMRRVRVPPTRAGLIVLVTAFHPALLVGTASAVFSDLSFCALTYLLLWQLAEDSPTGRAAALRGGALSGVIAGVGYLVRGNGITLIALALLDPARRTHRRYRWAGCLLGLLLILTTAKQIPASTERAVPSGDYRLEMEAAWTSPAAGMAIVARNVRAVAVEFPTHVLLPALNGSDSLMHWIGRHRWLLLSIQLVLSVTVLSGMLRLARRSTGIAFPAWAQAFGTLAIFLVWPWTTILDRFLLGLFPLVMLAFGAGLERAPRRFARMIVILMAIGILAMTSRSLAVFHLSEGQWPGASHRASLSQAFRLIETKLVPEAVVAARWPDAVYLATGRQAVPLTEDDDLLMGRFDRVDRLRLWMDVVPERPFVLLVRGLDEDPAGADRAQARALSSMKGITLGPIAATPDGRYELLGVVRQPR